MTKKTFVAEIEWGLSNDDIDEDALSADVANAQKLWKKKDKAAFSLIAKNMRCVFIPGNLAGDVAEVLEVDDEIVSKQITVIGLDFSDSNLPKVKAIAVFELNLVEGVGENELSEWQDTNDMLDNAISFEWDLPDLEDDSLDLAMTNHDGLSFSMK